MSKQDFGIHSEGEWPIIQELRDLSSAQRTEWGVTYATDSGDLHTEWGYTRNPIEQIDRDGEIQVGKRDRVRAYEILSRPVVTEVSVWQSIDCPWRTP